MKYLLPLFISIFLPCTGLAANNYLLDTSVIKPVNVSSPSKGASYTDSKTGAKWTKRSNVADMGSTTDAMIVYSRYSPTNSNGQYLLVHGDNSTSCYVYRLSDNVRVVDLKMSATRQIGEVNEIRWDYTGNFPDRVYFISGMKFYQMDVITGNGSPTVIHDFAVEFPGMDSIMNDVEGDSSADSRYWAWQVLGPYDGAHFPRKAIITYDKQTDTILGRLKPGDVTPVRNASSWTSQLPRPNMVEISPDGTKVMTNYGRAYSGSATYDFQGTALDAPRTWNLNFTNPVRVGWDEDHSGWAFLADGTQVFVSKDGGRDMMQYCRTDGVGGAYPNNCADFFDYTTGDYYGHHWARMPASKPGWILLSTYSTSPDKWQENQLIMLELKPIAQNPRHWRVSPQYHLYNGDYRDEASAAISQDGNKIYVTTNWMNYSTGHGEAYEIDITGWADYFGITKQPGVAVPAPILNSITPK